MKASIGRPPGAGGAGTSNAAAMYERLLAVPPPSATVKAIYASGVERVKKVDLSCE